MRTPTALDEAVGATLSVLTRLRRRSPDPKPFVEGETRLIDLCWRPGLLGLFGMLLVLWGSSRNTSPFTLNHYTDTSLPSVHLPFGVEMWYFGTGPVRGHSNVFVGVVIGVVAVYSGMFLVVRAWMALLRVTRQHPGIPIRRFVPVFVIWLIPMLVVAPLFSHDAYSYVAQGDLVSFHMSPYKYEPSVIGIGGSAIPSLVDHWWTNSLSPYGPVFLWLGGVILKVTNHSELASLVGFRLLALAGVALIAVFTPRLARSYGFDPAKAFVLVAINPIVLFHLIGGEHNDALMVGLLVAGLSLAKDHHPIAGILLCSLAALVKVPALIGVVYIGWDWRGSGVRTSRRYLPAAGALAISGMAMAVVTWATGLGWGWVPALSNGTTVPSWMDPGTDLGNLFGWIIQGFGLGQHSHFIVEALHIAGLALAAGIGARLLLKADGIGSLRAIGLSLIAVVLLGPAVQPWYFAWGIIVLAPIATGRIEVLVVSLSVLMSFLGLPGGRRLLSTLASGNVLVILLAIAVLVVVALLAFGPDARRAWLDRRHVHGPTPSPAVPNA